ncbi:uncharacterized protein LOC114258179 isoform X5 [Camellia sinensis]|uniref:uncharacterized protein LOC114258179 isoform X5 n=1 Tax=Camellia sinensis TaxID=4442 RepID=UPI0010362A62|nr:uncharacterized protein LOC114258179 isoform X5 [Camellia sinensis]
MAWRRFATLLRQRTDDINDGARKIVSLGVGGCIGCLFCDWFYEIHGMQPSKERSVFEGSRRTKALKVSRGLGARRKARHELY